MARCMAGEKSAILTQRARALALAPKHRIDKRLRGSIPVGRDVMRDQLWCNIGNAIRIDHMDLAIAFCPTAKFTLVKSPIGFLTSLARHWSFHRNLQGVGPVSKK